MNNISCWLKIYLIQPVLAQCWNGLIFLTIAGIGPFGQLELASADPIGVDSVKSKIFKLKQSYNERSGPGVAAGLLRKKYHNPRTHTFHSLLGVKGQTKKRKSRLKKSKNRRIKRVNGSAHRSKNKFKKIKILSFDQLAKLNFLSRVAYIEELRSSYLTLTNLQKKLKLKGVSKYANFNVRDLDAWINELLVAARAPLSPPLPLPSRAIGGSASQKFLRGIASESEPKTSSSSTFGRGLKGERNDHCIYAMTLQSYSKKWNRSSKGSSYKRTKAFYCARPTCSQAKRCTRSKQPPTKCGFIGSGLVGNNRCLACGSSNASSSRGCYKQAKKALCSGIVPLGNRKALSACNKCASNSNPASCYLEQEKAQLDSNKEFKELIKGTSSIDKTATDKNRACDNARIEKLSKIAYSSMAMAELIYAYHYRAKGNKVCDGKSLPNIAELNGLKLDWNGTKDLVGKVFSKFTKHCQQPLDENTKTELKEIGNRKKPHQYKKKWLSKEEKRAKLLKGLGKKTATVGNVIQPVVCAAVDQRIAEISKAFDDIVKPKDNDPPKDPVEKPKKPPAVEAKPLEIKVKKKEPDSGETSSNVITTPIKPEASLDGSVVDNSVVNPVTNPTPKQKVKKGPEFEARPQDLGCKSDPTYAELGVNPSIAMSCVKCATESMVARSGQKSPSGDPYKMSSRWSSLLTVLARQCGIVKAGGTDNRLTTLLAFKMTEALGHCSRETYEWTKAGPEGEMPMLPDLIKPSKRKLKNFWTDNYAAYPGSDPDYSETFEKFYGLEHQEMLDIFGCSKGKVKNPSTGKFNSQSTIEEKLKYLKQNFLKVSSSSKAAPPMLKNCIGEARRNVERFYDSQGGQCVQSDMIGTDSSKEINQKIAAAIIKDPASPGRTYAGLVIETDAGSLKEVNCLVASSYLSRSKNGFGTVTFNSPWTKIDSISGARVSSNKHKRGVFDQLYAVWDLRYATGVDLPTSGKMKQTMRPARRQRLDLISFTSGPCGKTKGATEPVSSKPAYR